MSTDAYNLNHDFYSQIAQNVCFNTTKGTFSNKYNYLPHYYKYNKKYLSFKNNKTLLECHTDTDLAPNSSSDSDITSTDYYISHSSPLGNETDSIVSLKNIRNISYLKSTENESIDTLILKLAPPVVETKKPDDSKPEIVTEKKNWLKEIYNSVNLIKAIDSNSTFYLSWLALVSLAYIYNIFGITSRLTFDFDNDSVYDDLNSSDLNETNQTNFDYYYKYLNNREFYWFLLDYLSDFIYLLDIFFIQTRLRFLNDGVWVSDLKSTALNYFKSSKFRVTNFENLKICFFYSIIKIYSDILTILPTDLIQLLVGISPLCRLNRVFKLRSLLEYFDRWDRAVQSFIFIVRLVNCSIYRLVSSNVNLNFI